MTRARDLADIADLDISGTLTLDGLTVSGDAVFTPDNDGVRITGANYATLRLEENDTTDLNTTMFNSGGAFSLYTSNDARSSITQRLNIDHATGDISFYEDTGTTAKLFWDASTERLAIGNATPSSSLDILAPANNTPLTIKATTDSYNYTTIKNAAGNDVGYIGIGSALVSGADADDFVLRAQRDNLIFTSGGNTERMRINGSSGNLLVGKTNDADSGSGVRVRGDGLLQATRANADPVSANRTGTDGDVIAVRKDGSLVGSWGSISGVVSRIVLDPRSSAKGSGITGGSIDANTGIINPADKTGAAADGVIDLGSTGARWQNLFLSGGVYLGGTAAANKLDSYEEGTWAATAVSGLSSIGSSTTNNRYTKIGNVVSVIGEIYSFAGQTSDVLEIGGLPYAVGSGFESSFSVMFNNVNLDSGYTQIVGYAKAGTAQMRFYELGDNIAYNVVAGNQTGAGTSMIFQMTYHT